MKRILLLSLVVTIISICFSNSASAQIMNPRPYTPLGTHQLIHPRNYDHNHRVHVYSEDEKHENGLHKGWSNPKNPHSGLKRYKRKD